MRNEAHPRPVWPEGCYGSAAGWLVFVGPSPGGGSKIAPARERVVSGGRPLWNLDFTDPMMNWSNGFRASIRPFVETMVGMSREKGAWKVFTVVNFHWQQNPDAAFVPEDGMRTGAAAVLAVLAGIRPRVVVTMERRADQMLRQTLCEAKYNLVEPVECSALVAINDKGRAHRRMSGYRVDGEGALAGCIIVRSPQHPARIYNSQYASRCARAIRSFVSQVHEGNRVFIKERA
jgi:hypothetical protein